MLFTTREEQLVKAFLKMGKLSLKEITDILQVSSRTVYRTIADLTESFQTAGVELVKDGKKYYLSGDLSALEDEQTTPVYSASERLIHITYYLLTHNGPVTNEELQEQFWVSNVTIIQDVAQIEHRLSDFGLTMMRQRGYQIAGKYYQKRRLLAILLSNAISIQDFWMNEFADFSILDSELVEVCRQVFEQHLPQLGEVDPKLKEFLMMLLAFAGASSEMMQQVNVSKDALEFSQKVFADLSQKANRFYNIQDIIFFASVVDETILKRQEVPLFLEKFDSEFFYSVTQLVDSISRFTKIEFVRDEVLFKLLFNHLRLSLAVPVLFPEYATSNVAYLATQRNQFLHSVVSLVMRDIFPAYIQSEYEYELVTLHFASSLRRSPDIYPIRLLLLTDERPLMTSVLVSKIQSIAPFVEQVVVESTARVTSIDMDDFDYCLATRPIAHQDLDIISTYPSTQEILELQEKLQYVQEHRTIKARKEVTHEHTYDLQKYLQFSSSLLQHFDLLQYDNPSDFAGTVAGITAQLDFVTDSQYLSDKLLSRFEASPLAIPNTNLALLHTQSSKVQESRFVIVELEQAVPALSMNHQTESVRRILVMLTKLGEKPEVRDLMTAISQSIIENNLYTEIYRTGNKKIIYQLMNTIFNEKIKKLEN